MKTFLLILGWIFVALGFIGAFLPIMPTTIFLILALPCFARSSPRFEQWLLDHPAFGRHLRMWRETGAISRHSKVLALVTLWPSILVSSCFVPMIAKVILISIASAVSIYIVTRPTQ